MQDKPVCISILSAFGENATFMQIFLVPITFLSWMDGWKVQRIKLKVKRFELERPKVIESVDGERRR